MSTALDRLAERCGIQSSLVDVFGEERSTGADLKQALLAAMNYPVSTEEEAQAALAQIESREWSRSLPPVLVVHADKAVNVPVNVAKGRDQLAWTLTLEDSRALTGQVRCADLPVTDERQLEGQGMLRLELLLPADLPWGYHSLRLEGDEAEMLLIVTPGKCWLPSERSTDRFWGLAASLFLLRSERNWGIGDFTDLRDLVRLAHSKQADVVGVNPLHAMFLDDPEQASPYSPSDRTLLNVLNIDVEAIPELAFCEPAKQLIASEQFQERLAAVRKSPQLQYETVAELKMALLQLVFATFEEQAQPARLQELESFHQERKVLLDRACLFQAMRAYFSGQISGTHDLPAEYRSACSPAVAEFADEQAHLVRFQLWMQWIADSQLKEAGRAAGAMAIGLYRDLAVGAHPDGAEVWSYPGSLVTEATVGAPPDILSPAGQNWGLPPLHPIAAREDAYSSFIDLLRANMRYAGALRIDHAMALLRLYWIPKGNEPRDGAYVHYPMEDLIGILALESQRNKCLLVGEDLGTVPEGFSERLNAANILSYRVFFFEKDEDGFFPPDSYPRLSISVAGNHDLPTIAGWWASTDIDLKERLGLFPNGTEDARQERDRDRRALIALLAEHSFLPQTKHIAVSDIVDAVHAFLSQTNSVIAMAQIDDVTEEKEQVNLPGTSNENPNWRRRLSRTIEELATDPRLDEIAQRMSSEGSPPIPTSSSSRRA